MAITIDEFNVGQKSGPLMDVTLPPGYTDYREDVSILGGSRLMKLTIHHNPFETPTNLDVSAGHLKLSTGAGQFLGLQLLYGVSEDYRIRSLAGRGVGDFRSFGSALRTNFCCGVGKDINVTYAVTVYTASGAIATYVENVHPKPHEPTSVDFPFERFETLGGSSHAADFSAVTSLYLGIDTWGDFVINSIEIV
ncbi:MAG: hypothetical protein KDI79_09590 [Anaerolineae bacterium]|nr:hypothetical protein [Anaerolineae bacterium]